MTVRIERYLAERLAGTSGWTGYAPISDEQLAEITASFYRPPKEIELLQELGLLSAEEADTWRARWPAREGAYQPPPGAAEKAAAFLATIDEEKEPWRYLAVRNTYESLGLLERPEYDDAAEDDWVPDAPNFEDVGDEPTPLLQRVVRVGAGPVAGVVLTEVAIHDRLVELRWRLDPEADGVSARTKLQLFHSDYVEYDNPPGSVVDDVGTRYDSRAWGGHFEEDTIDGYAAFEPAPPSKARVLTVQVGDATFEVPLA